MTAWALLALLTVAAPPDPIPPSGSVRQLVVHDCVSEVGRREVVLYSDGTIRRTEGLRGEEGMELVALDPDRLDAFLRRLDKLDLPEASDLDPRGPEGEWVEECTLEVARPGEPRHHYTYRRYDSRSLELGALVRLAEDLLAASDELLAFGELPREYTPRPGDVLERNDGKLFEIVRETGDGGGLELIGVEQPITVYVPKGALRQEFQKLVSRREP